MSKRMMRKSLALAAMMAMLVGGTAMAAPVEDESAIYQAIDAKADAATEDARHATFIATATDLDARITAEATARQEAVAQEAITRDAADTRLQSQIDTKADAATEDARHATFVATATDLDARITAEATARQEAVAQEAITRDAADTRLQSQIDTKADAATEDARHEMFVATATDLDARITAEATARQEAVAQESLTRWQEDLRLEEGINANKQAIAGLNSRVNSLDGRVDKVGAGAAALAALHPLDYDSDNKLSFAAGVGNYAGETAGAVGAFYRPNEDVMFSIGGTAGNGENMVNLGASFAIGKGSSGIAKMSKVELVNKVQDMEAKYKAVDAENKDLRNEL
ncbi:MAG: YadA-like family protein, partial [Selenomonadales bacterium]|nr:YadA-like family protein [Selenomonadales bacterium]